ncbi:MAG: hypothetical protein HY084_03495 [Gemmatimonadetes bacterium]|nr:hypothetical protein [Gemmatimonadota bacterium]
MTGLHALWLPIVLSAVVVFVLSSVIHMMMPWHKGDYAKVPNEDEAMNAVRAMNLAPGDYMAPRPSSMEDMKSAAFTEKAKRGPRFVMTVMPGYTGMGQQLGQWFVYTLVVSAFAAYVAGRALAVGAPYLHVFRFTGAMAFASYALALAQLSIWYGRSWRITITTAFDGLLYALFTAGIFGWLWPR